MEAQILWHTDLCGEILNPAGTILECCLCIFEREMIIEHDWGTHREAYITVQHGKGIICAEIQIKSPDTCILHDLFVSPAHQRHGCGRKLIQEALNYATRNGCRHAILSIAPNTAIWIRAWYERLGFQEFAINKIGCRWLKKGL